MKRPRDTQEEAAAAVPPVPPLVGESVYPGDEICAVSLLATGTRQLLLGVGVYRDGDSLFSSRCGTLRYDGAAIRGQRLWVEGEAGRYVPALGDHVVGRVESKHADEYRLHIGAASPASLPLLAFDGATRRNRPHLEVGALVYARVTLAHRDMQPECSCAAPPGVGAKDWVTKESVFGELAGGFVFACPQLLCRRLMASVDGEEEAPPVLDALGARAPFELAVGANHRVWIATSSAAMTVLAQLAILRSQGVADEEQAALVEELSHTFELDVDADGTGAAAAAAANAFMQSLGSRPDA